MKARLAISIVLALVLLAGGAAMADTYSLVLSPGNCGSGPSCDSYTFTTLVNPVAGTNNYDISFDVANTGKIDPITHQLVYDPAYLQGFSLTLFDGGVSGSTVSAYPALANGITVSLFDNSKFKNGDTTCGTGTHPGSICLDVTSVNGIYIGAGAHQQFDFTLALAPGGSLLTDSWHVTSSGTRDADGSGGNAFALSNDGTPVDPPGQTPEPASLALLGTGFAGAGLCKKLWRKKP